MALTADHLAQYRGCEPSNDCYFECAQVAHDDLTDPEADQGELQRAAAWAATQQWFPGDDAVSDRSKNTTEGSARGDV
jgi:hypothetical protein